MGLIKEKFEILNHLDDEDLRKATTSSQMEDVWTALLFTRVKISKLVENGVGQKDKSFSSRAELKTLKFLEDLLEKRYKFLQRRIQKKKDKTNAVKQQKADLYKLVDSGIMTSLLRENAVKTRQLEQLKLKAEITSGDELISHDTLASKLRNEIQEIMRVNNVPIEEAIKLLNKEKKKTAISNEAETLLDKNINNPIESESQSEVDAESISSSLPDSMFDVLASNESLTKANPIHLVNEDSNEGKKNEATDE